MAGYGAQSRFVFTITAVGLFLFLTDRNGFQLVFSDAIRQTNFQQIARDGTMNHTSSDTDTTLSSSRRSVQYIYCPSCIGNPPFSGPSTCSGELSPLIQMTSDPYQKDVIWWWTDDHKEFNDTFLLERGRVGDDWKLIVYDYADLANWGQIQNKVIRLANVTNNHVYLIVRTVSKGKTPRSGGTFLNFTDWLQQGVVRGIKQFHFPVRDDIVEAIEEVKQNETITRSLDIAHFWPPGVKTIAAKKRARTTATVHALGSESNLTFHADIVGFVGKKGRNGVNLDYIRALLQFKIVVVCQRDMWYGHYRLMEALVGGAMVVTDAMVGYPAGVVHGKTVVVFTTQGDLRRKLLYYLAHEEERRKIAEAGYELAMTRHRCQHRWEDLLMGDWENRDENGFSVLNP